MKTRKLGHSNMELTEIGLGCMNLGTNEANAKEVIDAAIDQGINYLDTADLYDFGTNEKLVGNAIKGKRDDLIIGTKGGNHFEEGKDDWYWDPSKKYLKEAIKNSLLRLGLDYVDLYQLHGGTIEDPIDEVIETFEELQQEGLVKHFGISSIRPNVIQAFTERSNITSVMMQYSVLDRRPEEKMLNLLDSNNINVLARGVLGKGMLTDRGLEQWEKKGQEGFLDYQPQELKNFIQEYQNIAKQFNRTPQSLAIGYALNHHAIGSIILGASKPEQVIENVRAYDEAVYNHELFELLNEISKENFYDKHRE
ncbi:oxidoreductase [Halalkalibacillus sediminis]|uniref:Oxidoreductase n=1 Tax=Halalkalibacillus sediminis TaxID=2018042 RepID=A0A2I0QX73_9BACI|nr:aldo/keto reductase [Halalkalibacillus sediminis]PKR78915.1 oxidoreductase [Halalkalibacillus sediminis]